MPQDHESARLLGPTLGCFVAGSPNGDRSPGSPNGDRSLGLLEDSRLPKYTAHLKRVARGLGSSHGDHLRMVA